jgi:low temperature requirement protein LtrA
VALGESVAAIGIGGARLAGQPGHGIGRLAVSAVLGLALAAALWWAVFGSGDEERAERQLAAASAERRTALALSALFYGNIPLLLGLVATAAGVQLAVRSPGLTVPAAAAAAAVLAAGTALFLAGDGWMRYRLRIGPARLRAVAAVTCLATTAAGLTVGLSVQVGLLAAVLVAALAAEPRVRASSAAGCGKIEA